MSSGNVLETLFRQQATIGKLVLDGKRDPEEVSRIYQSIIANKRLIEAMPADEQLLAEWAQFYKDVFGWEVNFSGLVIPARKPGFDRLLVIAQGTTPQTAFDWCASAFSSWKYTDNNLDEVITSDRTAMNGHYAVWVRDRQEADDELKSLSANHLKEQGIPGITIEERELYELKFFKETGDHLDKWNWTLCAGSRCSDGFVPCVFWRDGGFRVLWHYPVIARSDLRARAVVS